MTIPVAVVFFPAGLSFLAALSGVLIISCGLILRKCAGGPRSEPSTKKPAKTPLPELEAAVETLTRNLAQANERLDQVEAAHTPKVGGSLDLNVRSKILRLCRFGQSPEQISAALRIPIGEVLLTLKVHDLVVRNAISSGGDEKKIVPGTRNLLHSFDM